jgi:hypothetical protein
MRHTEIARDLNLSPWTIAKIADDWRRMIQLDPIPEDELPMDDGPADYDPKNLRRCPGCGAMVYMWPCVACRIIAETQHKPNEPRS